MSNKFRDSSYESSVANAVFVFFMSLALFSNNPWICFIFYLTVGNSCKSYSFDISSLPLVKKRPTFLGMEKEFVWDDSVIFRMLGGLLFYPNILFLIFGIDKFLNQFLYMIAGFILGLIFKKTLTIIFCYLIVSPTIILIRIVDCIAAFLSRHKLIRRTSYALISCVLILCIGFWLSPRIFPRRVASTSSSSSQAQYREEPRQGEVVSKESETVWIPTHGGTKYHRRSTCSGMEDPEETTKEDAIQRGFEPCQKCY